MKEYIRNVVTNFFKLLGSKLIDRSNMGPKVAIILLGAGSLVFVFQNCAPANFDKTGNGNNALSTPTGDVTEDELYFSLTNGAATVAELEYSKVRFADYLAEQVSNINASGRYTENMAGQKMPIGDAINQIANDLKFLVDDIKNMIVDKKIPTNSQDVLKKYTQLEGLLARAREINNFLILKADLGGVKIDIAKLRVDFTALQASLTEVRETLIPALRDELKGDIQNAKDSMVADLAAAEQRLNAAISASEQRSAAAVVAMQKTLIAQMNAADANLQSQIDGVQALANSNLLKIQGLTSSVANIDAAIKLNNAQLQKLTNDVTADLVNINQQITKINTSGNENYAAMVQNWDCTRDMIENAGATLYGQTTFAKLGMSVSEACVQAKENVLFSICVERYPTFCGACKGSADPKSCTAWQETSGKDRLNILMNIRQEVAIHYLNDQSKVQGDAIYGGASCKIECLNKAVDPDTLTKLKDLSLRAGHSPVIPTGGTAPVCTGDEWKDCGLYGITYSLAVRDANIMKNVSDINTTLGAEIKNLRQDFETERMSVVQRFKNLDANFEAKLNAGLAAIKAVTEARFMAIAQAMAGMASDGGTAGVLGKKLTQRSVDLALLASAAAGSKTTLLADLGQMVGKSAETVKAQMLGQDDELIRLLSNGLAVSSMSILTQFFISLNPNQAKMPYYDAGLGTAVAGKCTAATIKKTPFTNVLGRDPHELLAIAYMRFLMLGTRSDTAANNSIFFNLAKGGIIKSSDFQKHLVARLFAYAADPSQAIPADCSDAIDKWASDVLLNDSQFATERAALTANAILARMAELFVEDGGTIMTTAGGLEIILSAAPTGSTTAVNLDRSKMANLFAKAAIDQRRYKLVNDEVEGMIAVQKEVSAAAGFENEFTTHLATYRTKMAEVATKAEVKKVADDLATEITDRKADVNAVRGDVTALAGRVLTVEGDITTLKGRVDQIEIDIQPAPLPDPTWKPVILAIRHVTQGDNPDSKDTQECWGTNITEKNIPTTDAFVGGWGMSGAKCQYNFRSGTNFKDQVLYRIWGAAHKIKFISKLDDKITSTVDFTTANVTTLGSYKVLVGTPEVGMFTAQVKGILQPFIDRGSAYNEVTMSMTPIQVLADKSEKSGTAVDYSMTLYSPLVFDFLNHGQPQTIASSESLALFDITGGGKKVRVGWISGQQGALLALDLNHNGRIDSGAELFGEFTTIQSTGLRAAHGYEALAQYDLNRDGIIDESDPIFSELRLWFDEKADGLTQRGELKTLSEMKVTGVGLEFNQVDPTLQNNRGNRILYSGKFYGPKQCGANGCSTYDIYFNTAWTKMAAY